MLNRCRNPRVARYPYYGGRGIRVCDRWQSFEAFLADMGERPGPGYQLDRIDNDGHYEPGNCRWVTLRAQRRNRRDVRLLVYNGEARTAAEWDDHLGFPRSTVYQRMRVLGWDVAKAITTPLRLLPPRKS